MTNGNACPPPLPDLLIEPLVRTALLEDLGRAGDLTSQTVVPEGARSEVSLRARKEGSLAGLTFARLAFQLIEPRLTFEARMKDGDRVENGDVVAHIAGPSRGILTGERVALNFLGHLSGIATSTRALVDAAAGTNAKICCTRKTTPGLRSAEKHAVLCGGGANHRFGLDDAILIKDNHIAMAGGVKAALEAARAGVGHMVAIEIEVDTLDQLDEALSHGARVVLLDNMSPETLVKAVAANQGRAMLEASGTITIATVAEIAATGVDYISSGAITHSSPCLDIGLDFNRNL